MKIFYQKNTTLSRKTKGEMKFFEFQDENAVLEVK